MDYSGLSDVFSDRDEQSIASDSYEEIEFEDLEWFADKALRRRLLVVRVTMKSRIQRSLKRMINGFKNTIRKEKRGSVSYNYNYSLK